MLKVLDVIERVQMKLGAIAPRIAKHDRDLARQLRKAAASVMLNASEGSGSSGGTRKARYENGLRSMRESRACLITARAFGYIRDVDPALLDEIDRVNATLWRLIH
jgi:four helix bundle protein